MFTDKTCIITGGASGIGKAFATSLAKQGAEVVIADINLENAKSVASQLEGRATAVQCDVTSFPSVLAAFKAARAFSKNKRVDIVLSNAGTLDLAQPAYPAAEAPTDIEAYYENGAAPDLKAVDISLVGGLYVSHVALAQFRAQGADKDGFKGKIVLAGSEAGIVHMPGDILYGVAKAGVNALARSLGARVASEGITVNAYAPNLIETNIGPPELFAGAKARNQLTSTDALVEAVTKYFLAPNTKLSGHILGAGGEELKLRSVPRYFNEHAEKNAEVFFPPDLVAEALKVPEGTEFREL